MANIKKKIRKIRNVLRTNKSQIKRIVVSEQFMMMLQKHPVMVDISVGIDKETEAEVWFLYGVPMVESLTITKGALLEMKNDTFVILKSD